MTIGCCDYIYTIFIYNKVNCHPQCSGADNVDNIVSPKNLLVAIIGEFVHQYHLNLKGSHAI